MAELTSIVIPTFANHTALARCLYAIRAQTDQEHETIIVDQGTGRGCVEATNQGLRAARGDVLVMMNDDCVPESGWLAPLLSAIDDGAWLVSPRWVHARLGGHCLAMPRVCYETLGPLEERFCHWYADQDYELKVADLGKPIRQVGESVVSHSAEDPMRIHYRFSSKTGNWEELPNVGQWYLEDSEVWRSIWGERTPHELPGYEDGWK